MQSLIILRVVIYNGSGLGLYMEKIIIQEYYRGQLEVQNTLNGVFFRVILEENI